MKLFNQDHLASVRFFRSIPVDILEVVRVKKAQATLISIGVYKADGLKPNWIIEGTSEGVLFSGNQYHQLLDRETKQPSWTLLEIKIDFSVDWKTVEWAKFQDGGKIMGISREGADELNKHISKLYMRILKMVLENAVSEYEAKTYPMCGKKSYKRYASNFIKIMVEKLKSANNPSSINRVAESL